jgi:hypothetical protein
MKFDIELHRQFNDIAIIDYGIIKGNNNIVFIKSGQDGSMYGYNNKYLNIALNINKTFGSTVICSSNPFDGNNPLADAMEVISQYVKDNNFNDYDIYYMVTSNGAIIGVQFGVNYSKIKRMLLINTPLFINLHKTKAGIRNFSGEKITMIYGSLDPSSKYTELLSDIKQKNFEYHIINGQDHFFLRTIISLDIYL